MLVVIMCTNAVAVSNMTFDGRNLCANFVSSVNKKNIFDVINVFTRLTKLHSVCYVCCER